MVKGLVLITGASGLLGRQVLQVFKENDWDVTGSLRHSFIKGTTDVLLSDMAVHLKS